MRKGWGVISPAFLSDTAAHGGVCLRSARKIGWTRITLALDSAQIKERSPRGIRRLAALRAFLCVCRGWGISRDGSAGKRMLGGRESGQKVEVQ